MKTIEIIGFKRANLGKKDAKAIRAEGMVPCVMYGGADQIHFNVPNILFRDLIYTPEARMVDLNLEGTHYKCILQDAQFHPVNESILHVDFFQLNEEKPVKMSIPVKLTGTSVGVAKGGKLTTLLRKLKIEALPKDMPDFIELDVTELDLGKSAKVNTITAGNYRILNSGNIPVASIVIPRALRGKQNSDDEKGKK